MGQELFQQEIGWGHVRIHKHSDSSSESQAWQATRVPPTPSLPLLSPPAGSPALVIMAHICSVRHSLQSVPEFTEGFASIVMVNGGDGGIFSLETPSPHHSHPHLPQSLA